MLEPISKITESQIRKIEERCRKRLEKNPADLDAMFTLAAIRARFGDVKLALDMVEALLAVNPQYPGGLRLLAKLHEMIGNEEKSKECLKKANALSDV